MVSGLAFLLGPRVIAKAVPGIADHKGVLGKLSFPLPDISVIEREVFFYSKAKWSSLRRAICNTDWHQYILPGDANASATSFERELLRLIRKFIPFCVFLDEKKDHAWLDDHCRALVAAKRAASGTENYVLRRDECTSGLLEAKNDFVKRTRANVAELKSSYRE